MSAFQSAGKTDPGCVRDVNEDGFSVREDLGLFIVADGVGGHEAGKEAASVAMHTTEADITRYLRLGVATRTPPLSALKGAVEHANREVHESGEKDNKRRATTIALVFIRGGFVYRAHVGDSRIYLLRPDSFVTRLTDDHSVNGKQNLLTRALGALATVDVELGMEQVAPGDTYLLCTDGLWNVVTPDMIRWAMGHPVLEDAALCLVRWARELGGPDNITVVLMRLAEGEASGGA